VQARTPVFLAALIGAAILGGGAALGGASLFGFDGEKTIVREVAAPGGEPAVFARSGDRLTINDIYRRSAPGVVQITATSRQAVQPDPFFGNPFGQPQTQIQQALGSGFVIDKAGHVVTNYHVVQGASRVDVSFSNNEELRARVTGVDPSTDVAVLQVDAHSRALTPLELGNSDLVRVGDSVVAIGNPFGLDRSITAGIVSALQRPIQAPNGFTIDHVIQTDAALNHGNSGGPLLNDLGQVIGITSQILTGSNSEQSGSIGIGFAIPIDTARSVADQIIQTGHATHPYIGVRGVALTPELSQALHLSTQHGFLVEDVTPGSPAAQAGIQGGNSTATISGTPFKLGGDVITAVDGTQIEQFSDLYNAIAAHSPGDSLSLTVTHDGQSRDVQVTLADRPANS
jgi:S1-C subfamily serine protease